MKLTRPQRGPRLLGQLGETGGYTVTGIGERTGAALRRGYRRTLDSLRGKAKKTP